jgi:uncharacterized membrane protein YcaP (DUF421 family)
MDIIVRVIVVYLFLLVALRIMGKREFSQMTPMELVTLLLVPEIVSQGMVGDDFSLTNGVVGIATLFVLVYATSAATHANRRIESVVASRPTVLAHHGRLIEENLNRERISPDEVYAQLRMSGLERIDQVRWAVLESDGKIAVVPESH